MPEGVDDASARIARAKRLREQIERLKSGRPEKRPGRPPSIKEQLDERAGFPEPKQPGREE